MVHCDFDNVIGMLNGWSTLLMQCSFPYKRIHEVSLLWQRPSWHQCFLLIFPLLYQPICVLQQLNTHQSFSQNIFFEAPVWLHLWAFHTTGSGVTVHEISFFSNAIKAKEVKSNMVIFLLNSQAAMTNPCLWYCFVVLIWLQMWPPEGCISLERHVWLSLCCIYKYLSRSSPHRRNLWVCWVFRERPRGF